MSDIFVSHVEEDAEVAIEIAQGLEAAGYSVWYYERDSVPGVEYLAQVAAEIESSRALALIISPDSLGSHQVHGEVIRAYETRKPFIPILRGVTHVEFQQRQPVWRQALGAATSISIPPEGAAFVCPRIVAGLKALGIEPGAPKATAEALARAAEVAVGSKPTACVPATPMRRRLPTRALFIAAALILLAAAAGTWWAAGHPGMGMEPTRVSQIEEALTSPTASPTTSSAPVGDQTLASPEAAATNHSAPATAASLSITGGPPAKPALLSSRTPTPSGGAALPPLYVAGTPVPKPPKAIGPDNAAQVVQLARWGKGWATTPAYSPDGRFLAIASSIGVHLYDAASFAELRTIETNCVAFGIAFSQDSQLLAVNGDREIQLWRTGDGTRIETLEDYGKAFSGAAFSPDGQIVAGWGSDDWVHLWNVGDGSLLRRLEGHTSAVVDVAFAPDGDILASASTDETVRLWRTADGMLLRVLEGKAGPLNALGFSPDGQVLASGAGDVVQLWRVSDGALLGELPGHGDGVFALAFDPTGQVLASTAWDKGIRLWRVSDWSPLRTLDVGKVGGNGLVKVAFSPDGKTVASASEELVQLWDPVLGQLLHELEGYEPELASVCLQPGGSLLAPVSQRVDVELWSLTDGAERADLHLLGAAVGDVAFAPDGKTVAVGALDGTVWLIRVEDGTVLGTLRGHTSAVRSLAYNPDGTLLASGSQDRTVRLWKVSDGAPLAVLEGHADSISSLGFSPDGSILASASADMTIRLWQVADGSLLDTLEGNIGAVSGIAFAPDKVMLAAGYRAGLTHGSVGIWSVEGKSVVLSPDLGIPITSVAFSPDGEMLAFGAFDGIVRLMRVSDEAVVRDLAGHTGYVTGVAFSADGHLLYSSSADGTIRVWGVAP